MAILIAGELERVLSPFGAQNRSFGILGDLGNERIGIGVGAVLAAAAVDTLVESLFGQFVHEPGEHGAAIIHTGLSPRLSGQSPSCSGAL